MQVCGLVEALQEYCSTLKSSFVTQLVTTEDLFSPLLVRILDGRTSHYDMGAGQCGGYVYCVVNGLWAEEALTSAYRV
jgi:hypothetical protein